MVRILKIGMTTIVRMATLLSRWNVSVIYEGVQVVTPSRSTPCRAMESITAPRSAQIPKERRAFSCGAADTSVAGACTRGQRHSQTTAISSAQAADA